jgi:tRNA nucleotidyltransferase (CCA-adding enzyme)
MADVDDWSAEDWLRWALTDPRPGALLAELKCNGTLTRLPELAAMVDVPQDPQWHPEGPVDVHVGHVLNAAAEIAARDGLDLLDRAILIFSALTHDLGKPRTTMLRTKSDGTRKWTSYGHDSVGVPLARDLLLRLGIDPQLVDRVTPLVRTHMAYRGFSERETGTHKVRKLAYTVAPATMRQLARLIEADHAGRPPLPPTIPAPALRMLALAEQAGLMDGVPVPSPVPSGPMDGTTPGAWERQPAGDAGDGPSSVQE